MISMPLTRVVVVAWLTLLSIALVVLAVSLTRLDAQRRQDAPDAQIAELQTRALELEAFRASIEAAPAVVTERDFQQARDHWQQQWDTLNQRQQDLANATDLAALQSRLDALVQQINTAKPVATKPGPRATKPRATSITPTFQLLGIESRGGELFLAIQPNGTHGLAAVRLLRVGDAEGRWQLDPETPERGIPGWSTDAAPAAAPGVSHGLATALPHPARTGRRSTGGLTDRLGLCIGWR